MSKSRFVLDKFAKLLEQGLLSYKDLNEEIVNILKSKRDEIVLRMKLTSKEEFDILNKRVSYLEKKLNKIKKNKSSKITRWAKKS
jgi:BMFP domain-containing protein YqiC